MSKYSHRLLFNNKEKNVIYSEDSWKILWPPHVKSWVIGKDSDAGRDWGQEEKGTTEDEMAGWHHWLNERESGWTPGVGDGQGGLACCDSWGREESDTTERLNWTELNWRILELNPLKLLSNGRDEERDRHKKWGKCKKLYDFDKVYV